MVVMKAKIAAFLIGALFAASTAWALTMTRTETRMQDVNILIIKQPADPSFLVSYKTYDEQGLLRDISYQDYWNELTPSQKQSIRNIIDGIYNKLHNQNNIPTPTPVPSESPSPSMTPTFANVTAEE